MANEPQLNPAMAYTSPSSLTVSERPLPISFNISRTCVVAPLPTAESSSADSPQRGETDFFSGEPLRALSTLVFSDNIDLQRSASLTFAEITERGAYIGS